MRKIKVLVNGLSKDFGGVESFFLNVVKNIDNRQFQIDFICNDSRAAEEETFKYYGSRIFFLPRISKDKKSYLDIMNQIFDENYDVYHVNLTRFKYPVDLKIAKNHNVKIILHSHSTKIYNTNSIYYNVVRKMQFLLFKNYSISMADLLLSCSDSAGKFMFSNCKYNVLYNGINYANFYFNKDIRKQVRDEFNIGNDEILIGHIGRFSDEKNHVFLIKIMNLILKRNNKFKLILIGEGETCNNIKKTVKEDGLEDKVIFAGFQNNISKFLSAMDCFLLPSKHEALPISLIEAQVNGLPCLFSDFITSEIDLKENYRLKLDDVENWASIIIKDIVIRKKNNNLVFDDKFDNSRFIKEVVSIYEKII